MPRSSGVSARTPDSGRLKSQPVLPSDSDICCNQMVKIKLFLIFNANRLKIIDYAEISTSVADRDVDRHNNAGKS